MKPARVGLKTNLTITTNRHTYLLELSSPPQAWMASVSWDYPKDLMLALQKQAREAQVAAPVDCAKAHFFAEARHAHKLLGGGSTLGKIVLLPRSVKLLRRHRFVSEVKSYLLFLERERIVLLICETRGKKEAGTRGTDAQT